MHTLRNITPEDVISFDVLAGGVSGTVFYLKLTNRDRVVIKAFRPLKVEVPREDVSRRDETGGEKQKAPLPGEPLQISAMTDMIMARTVAPPDFPHAITTADMILPFSKLDRKEATNAALMIRDGYIEGTEYQTVKIPAPALIMAEGEMYGRENPIPSNPRLLADLFERLARLTDTGFLYADIKLENFIWLKEPGGIFFIDFGSIIPLGAPPRFYNPIYSAPELALALKELRRNPQTPKPPFTVEMMIFSLCWLICDTLLDDRQAHQRRILNVTAYYFQSIEDRMVDWLFFRVPSADRPLVDQWGERYPWMKGLDTRDPSGMSPDEQEVARLKSLLPSESGSDEAERVIKLLYDEGMSTDPKKRSSLRTIAAKLRELASGS